MADEKFTFFWNGPFSQWARAFFTVDGVEYNCAEQYMMAGKARLFGDDATLALIMDTTSPDKQKAYGRQVSNFDLDRWNGRAKAIVYMGNHAKFSQNDRLRAALFATAGTTLVEASPYDRIWGIGLSEDQPEALNRATWRGANWLGEVLTEVRDDLMKSG